ncbi:histone-lysine N-methyltransferase, H3 lysine-79 specific [Tothia fuscella]|uniref:Histone-lysine N-methyltransferase, H3 lysine-79 specific n=1 Tax=Tothia fuscella TaxID=1048955 RepID=A0A9P4NPJ7_9PEZI|nr:histone-lysine N-methyltransferase, H3 lysine-79 specific [Tothia fuscella]
MGDEIEEVELQYPSSSSREKFQLVTPLDREGYNPLEDIIQSIHHILTNYFPPTLSSQLTDDAAGLPRRLKRAVQTQSFTNFKSVITEFNDLITTSLSDGTIPTHLKTVHTLPLSLIERILSQVYSRTVSPEVHILKQYENGTDNVYGELLPRFTNQIFIETHLTSSQIFVDLGSGVGNVVLQAALQTGCQSWGIEFMPNPARLAQRQKSEFEARCRRWGIQPGSTHLLEGDFLTSSPITDILKKADVVLVNNQAFTPELNDNLVMKFLDLKDGCKVVSLKSFVPAKWVMKEFNLNDVRNLLHPAEVKEYFSDSVSWTDVGGTWFVAVKDSGKVGRFSEGIGRRGR